MTAVLCRNWSKTHPLLLAISRKERWQTYVSRELEEYHSKLWKQCKVPITKTTQIKRMISYLGWARCIQTKLIKYFFTEDGSQRKFIHCNQVENSKWWDNTLNVYLHNLRREGLTDRFCSIFEIYTIHLMADFTWVEDLGNSWLENFMIIYCPFWSKGPIKNSLKTWAMQRDKRKREEN